LDDPQRQLSDVWLEPAELGGIAHEPQVRELLGDALEHDAALEAAKGCAQASGSRFAPRGDRPTFSNAGIVPPPRRNRPNDGSVEAEDLLDHGSGQ
jgi:hypothetical protein